MDKYNVLNYSNGISIHALRVEGDGLAAMESHRIIISIHALRVEGDKTRGAS